MQVYMSKKQGEMIIKALGEVYGYDNIEVIRITAIILKCMELQMTEAEKRKKKKEEKEKDSTR